MSSKLARFEHDCDNCILLGQHNGYDLYHCVRHDNPNVKIGPCDTAGLVARWSADKEDYFFVSYRESSEFIYIIEPARVAYGLASKRGLVG